MTEEQLAAFACLLFMIGSIDDRNRGHVISAGILSVCFMMALSQVIWLHFKGAK